MKEGSDRVVYLDGSTVTKVAKSRSGIEQNQTEWKTWNNSDWKEQEVLAEVHSISEDGEELVMERGDVDPNDAQRRIDMRKRLDIRGMRCPDLGTANIGEINGEVKMIDYGQGCKPIND
jgi:hypothetical protein